MKFIPLPYQNAWFDEPSVTAAMAGLAHMLAEEPLRHWATRYPTEPTTVHRRGVWGGNGRQHPHGGLSRYVVRAAQRPRASLEGLAQACEPLRARWPDYMLAESWYH